MLKIWWKAWDLNIILIEIKNYLGWGGVELLIGFYPLILRRASSNVIRKPYAQVSSNDIEASFSAFFICSSVVNVSINSCIALYSGLDGLDIFLTGPFLDYMEGISNSNSTRFSERSQALELSYP